MWLLAVRGEGDTAWCGRRAAGGSVVDMPDCTAYPSILSHRIVFLVSMLGRGAVLVMPYPFILSIHLAFSLSCSAGHALSIHSLSLAVLDMPRLGPHWAGGGLGDAEEEERERPLYPRDDALRYSQGRHAKGWQAAVACCWQDLVTRSLPGLLRLIDNTVVQDR